MKKILFYLILLCAPAFSTYAQNRYVIFFTDKNNSPYSISNPSAFLSPRAILRRTQQNIQVTTQDLPVNPAYVNGVIAAGGNVLNTSKWFNSVTIDASSSGILSAVQALPYVNQVVNVGRLINPSPLPPKFDYTNIRFKGTTDLTAVKTASFNYGTSFNQVNMLKGDLMHDNGYTGAGKIIAVLDAGFVNANAMPVFDSLFANNQILATWDFVDNEVDVYDDDAHGTMVLSTIGGNVPGELIGTAPGASFILLRSENAPAEAIIEEYNWAAAAEYADSAGADIINSSLGYTLFDDPSQNHSYADLDGNTTPISIAADIAASKGMVVCNSAGNEGNGSWFHISAPSDADSILGVGAVDPFSVYAQFSGKGPAADGAIKPNVAAQGAQTIVADPWNGVGVFPANGTSFSSPLMAGMVATLWQCHPTATNMQIINAIQQSASQVLNPDSLLGYGIPDFPMACLILSGLNPGAVNNGDNLNLNANPFGDELNFNFYTNTRQNINIRLVDLLGQVVYSKSTEVLGLSNNAITIPAHFAKGVYVLEVESKDNLISKKVVKGN
ncbi:MAG: S8 family peptidase [Bacteroidetes bacterium]|nr:S8 family peptidase [Bacteroidota bacterium]